ncbi:uncharacterized protein EHS24_001035 [Apiotrichum porosum]|uniref:Uncharacterized protein n=1 Tax=Apiotrichum porosum TaxID=105984 RepID=A0A427YBJ1_9TREE|nr:uncharacterized protein EHS24_001035 [Apiotrichum porosum]RSH88490.1 hypothetical protein EHS24_001035 [Apiotrichum porosum]
MSWLAGQVTHACSGRSSSTQKRSSSSFFPPPSNNNIATYHAQRYDSCFNLWFEGYLQPALDAASLAQRGALPHVSSLDAMPDPAPPTPPPPPPASASASTPPAQSSSSSSSSARRHSLITSWANASVFRRRPAPAAHAAGHVVAADDMVSATHVHVDEGELEPLDTTDMTPSQAKAAEYERQCGKVWKEYQACLKKAISANPNLTTLLEQARDDHPLHTMDGLEGTAWDPANKGSTD